VRVSGRDAAVDDLDGAVAARGELAVVGDHEEGDALVVVDGRSKVKTTPAVLELDCDRRLGSCAPKLVPSADSARSDGSFMARSR